MKLIAPSNITGEILKIIDEADEKLILISPYINFKNWPKLISRFKSALDREVGIKVYVRDGQKNLSAVYEMQKLGINPILIPYLHAKLYLNEKSAIVSSMNLIRSSDQYSLEIAHKVESINEYDEIISYYTRYIQSYDVNMTDEISTIEDEIYRRLKNDFTKVKIYTKHNSITINTRSNRFNATIIDENGSHFLQLSVPISYDEYDQKNIYQSNRNLPDNLKVKFIAGGDGYYNMVFGILDKHLDSKSITDIIQTEINLIAETICVFITSIEDFKSWVYNNRRS